MSFLKSLKLKRGAKNSVDHLKIMTQISATGGGNQQARSACPHATAMADLRFKSGFVVRCDVHTWIRGLWASFILQALCSLSSVGEGRARDTPIRVVI